MGGYCSECNGVSEARDTHCRDCGCTVFLCANCGNGAMCGEAARREIGRLESLVTELRMDIEDLEERIRDAEEASGD